MIPVKIEKSDSLSFSNLSGDGRHPNLQRFSHTAMATVFEIFILHEDALYAAQAAYEAFRLVDRLEEELSRFRPNSDISRVNRLVPGETLRVGLDAFACLRKSREMHDATAGAFDVTAGVLKDFQMGRIRKKSDPPPDRVPRPGMHHLQLDEGERVVRVDKTIRVDLGAIGKGYAVDQIRDLLREWELDSALIHGGKSSVFAFGSPGGRKGWPVTISHPLNRKVVLARIDIQNRAMGGSGIEKGLHIIDPRHRRPAKDKLAVWVLAEDAAAADAWSTAFMVMDPDAIDQYCQKHSEIQALAVLKPKRKNQEAKIFRWGL